MTTEHVKIFSGSSIIVKGLQNLLDDEKIHCLVKDKFESARLAGFGEQMNSVELFVLNVDLEKANLIVDAYQKEINS
ncbi:DUF2007 domain-containing protein [Polaribacter pectinis]|uniref:DUF2007 domain-containing protein n=1 Tax=Polaribacter pectinis TaxID=2738844 RepID=A0A7G9LAS3_9FLAO|nr:DUF2007 domain-containing protein [Polaribacter pectinis]QNM85722.1 DUF2007 domain-containing protein [Polaribacter pectinis]